MWGAGGCGRTVFAPLGSAGEALHRPQRQSVGNMTGPRERTPRSSRVPPLQGAVRQAWTPYRPRRTPTSTSATRIHSEDVTHRGVHSQSPSTF